MTASRSKLAIPASARRRSIAARVAAALLPVPARGRLIIGLPHGETIMLAGSAAGVEASISFTNWRGFWRILRDGEIGFAQGWIDGDWSSPDLDAMLAFGLDNTDQLAGINSGSRFAALLNRVKHRLNANTRRGSRRNIVAHYDLGNAFYARWLDSGVNYSSALYRTGEEDLDTAQKAKLDRAVKLLGIDGGESVLEIGCGWGAMAERLIECGVGKVTGLTLSDEQRAFADVRLAGTPADIRLQDYRDCDGQFDRIVSIEMIEAVGAEYWATYFGKLGASLRPGGSALLQAITIADEHYEGYRRMPDFIQRYIFPGGMLPTKTILRVEAARAGLSLVHQETFGVSYALTLRAWRDRFLSAWPDIARLGFDERFRRMWLYYLVYCELGFRSGRIDVGFYKLVHSTDQASNGRQGFATI
ncbi:cyclopropane-fatty-acyl-phospholipid synthase family protein [uncultured Nitratireductor sp.]|uniref:SAM-dependent methyltransferase n=1 Tax=uncultured Nitratireductor sp. TaxID=520953 RepID=UPI0025D7C4EE|nr:cyclopropane-fatty-acyl-phospholipid synthase family protein [uncultured Nitratireductor sp.]